MFAAHFCFMKDCINTSSISFAMRYPYKLRYNSALSIWLSVDPLADKYPSTSPYTYCGNNPIVLKDPDGRTLEIGDNQQSTNDIKSIVAKHHRERIVIQNGIVSVNTDGLTKDAIENDAGLSLINRMVNADEHYYYEACDYALCLNSTGKRQIIELSNPNLKGCINASVNGFDCFNRHSQLPMEGFDGQVIIAEHGSFRNGNLDIRSSVVFHELGENYFKTTFGMNYQAAHDAAISMEDRSITRNFGFPGTVSDYTPPPSVYNRTGQEQNRILNYINDGKYR